MKETQVEETATERASATVIAAQVQDLRARLYRPQRDLFHLHGGLGHVNLDVVCGPNRALLGDDGAAHEVRRATDEFEAFQGELERHWRLFALEIDPLIGDRRGVWERRQMAQLDDRAAAGRQRRAGLVGDRALDCRFWIWALAAERATGVATVHAASRMIERRTRSMGVSFF